MNINKLHLTHTNKVAATAACKYASKLLKTGDAAQPKGCSAGFVAQLHRLIGELKVWDDRLAEILGT